MHCSAYRPIRGAQPTAYTVNQAYQVTFSGYFFTNQWFSQHSLAFMKQFSLLVYIAFYIMHIHISYKAVHSCYFRLFYPWNNNQAVFVVTNNYSWSASLAPAGTPLSTGTSMNHQEVEHNYIGTTMTCLSSFVLHKICMHDAIFN